MTLQLHHSDFLIYEENFIFFFISVGGFCEWELEARGLLDENGDFVTE